MTDRLTEIRGRLRKLGGWSYHPEVLLNGVVHVAGRGPTVQLSDGISMRVPRSDERNGRNDAAETVAEFIANAPEDIRWLLAQLRDR